MGVSPRGLRVGVAGWHEPPEVGLAEKQHASEKTGRAAGVRGQTCETP